MHDPGFSTIQMETWLPEAVDHHSQVYYTDENYKMPNDILLKSTCIRKWTDLQFMNSIAVCQMYHLIISKCIDVQYVNSIAVCQMYHLNISKCTDVQYVNSIEVLSNVSLIWSKTSRYTEQITLWSTTRSCSRTKHLRLMALFASHACTNAVPAHINASIVYIPIAFSSRLEDTSAYKIFQTITVLIPQLRIIKSFWTACLLRVQHKFQQTLVNRLRRRRISNDKKCLHQRIACIKLVCNLSASCLHLQSSARNCTHAYCANTIDTNIKLILTRMSN